MNNTLLTTLFASSLALLGLTLGKDNKVSEFRQAWIDSLRDDIAEFVANVQHMFAARLGQIPKDAGANAILRVNQLSSRIRLRLDRKKPESDVLKDAMAKLRELADGYGTTVEQVMITAHEVEDATTPILEKAWKRVQSGEKKYRVCYGLSILGLLLSSIALIWKFI